MFRYITTWSHDSFKDGFVVVALQLKGLTYMYLKGTFMLNPQGFLRLYTDAGLYCVVLRILEFGKVKIPYNLNMQDIQLVRCPAC